MLTLSQCSRFHHAHFITMLTFFIMLIFSPCSFFSSYLALGSVQQNEMGSNRKSTRGVSRLSNTKLQKTTRSPPSSDGLGSPLIATDQPRNYKTQTEISRFFTNTKKSMASPTNNMDTEVDESEAFETVQLLTVPMHRSIKKNSSDNTKRKIKNAPKKKVF